MQLTLTLVRSGMESRPFRFWLKAAPMTLPCRLYLITPPALDDLAGFGRQLAQALDGGDVAALQIGRAHV